MPRDAKNPKNSNRNGRRGNRGKRQAPVEELQERVVSINRVSKTVKGGRHMSMTALVVVGDGKGRVGVGLGKSAEVPTAIRKGVDDAKKSMFTVPVTKEGTLPHEVIGVFGAGRVLLKPATPGTGVIAGGPVRALMELAGIKNVLSKSLGTNNSMNTIKAAAAGLQQLSSPEQVARRRGLSVAKIYGFKPKADTVDVSDIKDQPDASQAEPVATPEVAQEVKDAN
jgi:small subunit ribosomal protein S5